MASFTIPRRPQPMVGSMPMGGRVQLGGLLLVVLDWLRVNAVRQHPALVVVRAQAELALLVRVHRAVVHAEAPVGCHVSAALESPLEPLGAHLVLAFVDALGGDLRLPSGPVLHVEALAAQGDAEGGLLLELEQAGLAVAPLVPGQPELLVLLELGLVPRPDGVLEPLAGECEVHAVRVHLDELKVPPVEVKVQELVVELEHAELRQLVDHDAHLKGVLDDDLVLAQLDLVGTADLLDVFEPGRAQMLVDLCLIAGVQGLVLPLHRFDELAVGAVAQELEHFCEQSLVLVSAALAPVVRHFLHEPAEDLAWLVVDGAVDRGEIEAAVEVPLQVGGVQENLLRRQDPQELRLLREALAPAVPQVVMHVLRHCAVWNTAVDEERGELLELGPQLSRDFDVHFREPEPFLGVKELGQQTRESLGVLLRRDFSRTAGHLLHHGAGVERVDVVPQDAPAHPRVLVLVGTDARLACHVLAGENKIWASDHRGLQQFVCLFVGDVKLGRLVTPARLQRLAQKVLLGYAREGNRVLEDVHPKAGVELLHLLERFQEGGDVQVVVVLQPVTESLHTLLTEDTVAVVVVLLQRENVPSLELGIPSHVGRKAGEVQLVWTVEPLVREPGLGQGGTVGLDPLVVRDARGQIVHHVQELELGGVYEHDATVLLRCEDLFVLSHERDIVLADELEIVVARVEPDHRHLGYPLQDLLALRVRDTLSVWKPELVHHIREDCLVATLQGLVEEADQLVRVLGDNVLGLGVQSVHEGYGKGHVLAFERKVAGRLGSLARVLVRLKVVDNRVGVGRRLLLWAGGVCPGGWRFVLPLLNHRVARVSQKLGSRQGETVRILPFHGLALAVPSGYHSALFVLLLHKPMSLVGIALLATMPEAAVVLEDGLRLGVITVHPGA